MKPLLFDTSAAWSVKDLRRLREAYPERQFFVPSVVVGEKLNELRRRYGNDFDMGPVRQFLGNDRLRLTVVEFDLAAAEILAEIASRHGDGWYPEWPEQRRNVRKKPCGERCRWVDHAVAALAKTRDAVLVVEDGRIIDDCRADPGFFPLARRIEELLQDPLT